MKPTVNKLVQTFEWGDSNLAVHSDTSGDLVVVESDPEGITIRAWKIAHLVRLAKDYDTTKDLEKVETRQRERIEKIENSIRTLEKAHGDLHHKFYKKWWRP